MINTVKKQGDGWLVNGTTYVPNDTANRYYQEVQEWIAQGNTPEPQYTDEQIFTKNKSSKTNEVKNLFNKAVEAITTALPHEMVSWRKQEDEARAYSADNTVATPFIDAQLITRDLGETKDDLVAKIIANADAYQVAYATILGKYQNLMKKIDDATTVEDLEVIGW